MGVMASQSQTVEDRSRVELRRTLASKEGQSAGLLGAASVGSSFGSMRRDLWFASDTQLSPISADSSQTPRTSWAEAGSFTGGVRFIIANVRRECAAV